VLDLKVILSLVSNAFVSTIECEGVAIYLRSETGFSRATIKKRRESWLIDAPDAPPESVTTEIVESRDAIVGKDLSRNGTSPKRSLLGELARLNWSLVLPLLSEDKAIGFIAVAPKLSGDPFYPHDLDLLMTLAHQAGIAIKNAQLYTQVVLANEYIENIVGTIESGVVAVDAGGRVTMFNRAAEQLTGLGADAVKQESVEALPAALGVLLKATVGDGVERTEPEIVLPDGTITRPVICTTSPLLDPAGAILGAVAVFSDLTPFKQLENERRRAERLAYFEILASSLAHEIKNPLVAIKTFAQLITRRHHDENFVAEFSRVVTREVNRMERLVERLRALSRPRDGRRTPVDVREPLRQAVEFLRPAFDEKRITITMSPGDGAATVLGDANELEQLFLNLLMNAHEATPPEGSVSTEISVSDTTVAVAVSDSGPGIPTDLLDHVFDPFITTKPRGSGLGLTISAGIATTHHARLWAANRPGGGALFQVDFPVAVQADTPREIADTSLTPVRAPRTPSDLP
jgi:PAS domain S-box-containing protein